LRSQFSHVIDIAPTILEAAGLPEPRSVNGTPQTPIEGTSMLYAFNNAKAPERHKVQYFEMFGNRGIYSDGWFARTIHRAPWQTSNLPPLTTDVWELFNTKDDFSLTNNRAAQMPAKLKEMQALFMQEAQKYRVLPIDDRVLERLNAALVGRPDLMGGRTTLTLHAGMKGMSENVFINVKNRSLTITADVETPARGANGVVLAQGGRFGGWSLYFKDGKPMYTYNFLGLQQFTVAAAQAVPAGKATIRFVFAYDGGLGKGGLGTLYVNDKKVAEGRIEPTQAGIFSADETADVGVDDATPVTEAYKAWDNGFTGKILKVTVDVKEVGAGEKTAAVKAGAEGGKK
jgi:arylsulfatase